ncbi:MAG: hypothetical protein AAGA18_07235 [Verrucomicrobiota bacterium]
MLRNFLGQTHEEANRVSNILDELKSKAGLPNLLKLKKKSGGLKIEELREVSQELSNILGQSHRELASLKDLPRVIEGQVQEVGKYLEQMDLQGKKLVSDSDMLLKLSVGSTAGETSFEKAIEEVSGPLEFLQRAKDEDAKLLALLTSNLESIGRMFTSEKNLGRTMRPLKYLQTMFKIESSALDENVQDVFLGLTKDIEKLHVQVADIFSSKFRELEEAKCTLNEVTDKFAQEMKACHKKADERRTQIYSSLEVLKADFKTNKQRDAKVTQFSKDVCLSIGHVVIGLQFQDIVSQKIEHVLSVLNQIEAHSSELQDITNEKELVLHLQTIYQQATVQVGQLENVQQDLLNAEDQIKNGLDNVIRCTKKADQECFQMSDYERVNSGVDGMVQVLLDAYVDVRNIFHQFTILTEDVYVKLRPLSSMASGLNERIRTLSAEIHLIALNSQVQAVRVQGGMGLETLASNTCKISVDTLEISRSVSLELDSLISEMSKCVASCDAVYSEAKGIYDTIQSKGKSTEGELHAYRDQTIQVIIDLGMSIDSIETQSSDALALVDFQSPMSQYLLDPLNFARKIRDAAGKQIDKLGVERWQDGDQVTYELADRYTMNSERTVHQQVASRESGLNHQLFSDSIGADNQSLGDVELF